jgi:hypothetical protein
MTPRQVVEEWCAGLTPVTRIVFQRGYWNKLSFLKKHGLPLD